MSAAHALFAAAARHAAAAAASAATAAEEHDLVALDLGGVALVAVLIVPLTRLEAAFDVDLLALGQVLGQRFGDLPPEHHAMPLGFFLLLPRLVGPVLGGRHVEGRHGGASRCIAQLGIASEVADQNHFVHAFHRASILLYFGRLICSRRCCARRPASVLGSLFTT